MSLTNINRLEMAELTKYQITKKIRGAVYRNRELCRFLKKNRIFTIFINNCISHILRYDGQDRYEQLDYLADGIDSDNIYDNYSIISVSFLWDETKQGFEYWNNVQRKYRDFFRIR